MKPVFAVLAATLFLAAACDRPPQPRTDPAAGAGPSAPVQPMPQTGSVSPDATKGGRNPQQGQVDPKQNAQQKDFQMRGDAAGPSSADTKPTN